MNRDLFIQRCRAGGIGIHKAAHQLSADPLPFLGYLDNPGADERMPVGTLRALSRLLDVSMDDLLEAPAATPHEPGDPARVEAAIATHPEGLTRDQLADAFHWPLERVERAVAGLETNLRSTGRRLKRIDYHRYALGPNLSILTADQQAILARSAPHAQGLTMRHASVLHHVLDGWHDYGIYKQTLEVIADLVDWQLIDIGPGGFTLNADVEFSLRRDNDADRPRRLAPRTSTTPPSLTSRVASTDNACRNH